MISDNYFESIVKVYPEFEVIANVDGVICTGTYRCENDEEARNIFKREFTEYTKPEFRAKKIEIISTTLVKRNSWGLRV